MCITAVFLRARTREVLHHGGDAFWPELRATSEAFNEGNGEATHNVWIFAKRSVAARPAGVAEDVSHWAEQHANP
jgi:hypothetical protein